MATHKITRRPIASSEKDSQQDTLLESSTDQRRELLNLVTQTTRFEILQNIFGHPEQLPSLKELDYFMPDTSKSTIRNHLSRLIDKGMVEKVSLPEDEQTRDNPRKFYGLTDECRNLLDETGLLSAEQVLQEATLKTQLTPDVEQYMNAPRPDWPPASPVSEDSIE